MGFNSGFKVLNLTLNNTANVRIS